MMARVIAGLYEIQNQIGAGGGGVVYLGRHIRLDKQVVLKADKRTLSVGNEKLRREVDMLKNLSQTYIPQVYDFVQEDGVVYTVMDFIEGESLDKLLGRKQIPTQPEVIKWSCQILEALQYLHNQPPYGILHGDIKPANIMLRPNGDICLIDYNIALALGEDGAVKVGYSRGYASPEHYGADYVSTNRSAAVGQNSNVAGELENDDDKTLVEADSDITLVEKDTNNHKNTYSTQQGIKLDVRSDIYSLGATLYHLISGCRPAQDALRVVPLGTEVCSLAVSAIIQKAMEPDPSMRYQSAEEMLTDFLQLHQNDKRVLRRKKHIVTSVITLTVAFLTGGICAFVGLKQLEQRQTALALAEYSANSLAEGNVSLAVEQALQAMPNERSILKAPVTAQAQKALTDALGVYDLSDDFNALDVIELPAVPFDVIQSPQGTYTVAVYAYELAIYETSTQQKMVTLPIQNSALSDVVFANDTHIIYAGNNGVTAYDLEKQKVLWIGEVATTLTISADLQVVASINRDEDRAVLYQVSTGEKIGERSFDGAHMAVAVNDIFADPESNLFALNADGSLLAVSFYNGGLMIFDIHHPENDLVVYEESEYRQFMGGFSGDFFAFAAEKSGGSLFGLTNVVEGTYLGGVESKDTFLLKTDERGIYLANANLLVYMDSDTLEETEVAYTNNTNITNFSIGEGYVLVATDDNSFSFFDSGANMMSVEGGKENWDFVSLSGGYAVVANRNEPIMRLLQLKNHSDALLLSYDARYSHDEARISQDGQTAMFFSYQNFRIYDLQGNLVTEVKLPDAESIFDQQFKKSDEGSWLEVIWYDGTKRCYSAMDGSLITESVGKEPSKELYEEFFVDKYRIASELHSAPKVYMQDSGKLVTTLEEDAYLTYVTKVGDYILTEYISTAGKRYGILLNDNFETLAYLPELCDVFGETLVFDYQSGNLRQSRLYSLQELKAIGEAYN